MHAETTDRGNILVLVFEFLDHDLKQFMASKYGKGVGMDPELAKVRTVLHKKSGKLMRGMTKHALMRNLTYKE